MDRVFFEELELPKPDHHLGVGSASHARQTAMMLERIEAVLQREKPERVLVYGDTNSTLAGALTASKMNIPLAHVEAGLRSYNRVMPEETNRVLTDHLSIFLFCPTALAVRNLRKEGIRNGKETVIQNVGDVMYDSILYCSELAETKSTVLKDLNLSAPNSLPDEETDRFGTPDYYLATLHRAENTDDPRRLKSILQALNEIAKETTVILPLHPRTQKRMEMYQLLAMAKRIRLIEPVSYLNMIQLERHAKIILTDSGGVQKEAYWFAVPCLTLREETEWMETVRSGWNVLVGAEPKRILQGVRHFKRKRLRRRGQRLFGDGKASEKIVQILGRRPR